MELTTETRRALALHATHNLPNIVVEESAKGQNVYPFKSVDVADAFADTLRLMGGTTVTQFDLSSGKGCAFNAQAYSIARKRSGM
jgi:hypothetical protein